MADLPWISLLPGYTSPQQMQQAGADLARTNQGTDLLAQQTTAAALGNQSTAMQLDYLKQAQLAAQQQPGGAAPPPGGAQPDSGQIGKISSTDQITNWAQATFAPKPEVLPPSVQAQAYLLTRGGAADAAKLLVDNTLAKIKGGNMQASQVASQYYQGAAQVVNAADGQAFATMERLAPDMAAKVKALYPDDTGDVLDADVRKFATEVGNKVHQYSGRPTEITNGELIDKNRNERVLGTGQVNTGLTPAEKASLFKEANEPVTVGNKLPTARWRAAIDPSTGKPFTSPDAYVAAGANAANMPNSTSGTTNAAGTTQGSGARTIAAPAAASTPSTSAASAAAGVKDPILRAALSDNSYNVSPLPVPTTQEELEGNKQLVQQRNEARKDLATNANDTISNGAQSIQYLQAAKAIMDSKGAPITGPLGGLVAKVTSAFGAVDATNYMEAAKYLGNAAIAAGKNNFGKGMTENDVTLQKDELSPSLHMTDAALSNLINSGIKNTQYAIDSAKRVGEYLKDPRKDPQRFADWNDTKFNRSATVNGPPPARTGQQSSGGAGAGPTRINSAADYAKVPPGATYIDPKGVTRTKGGA